jgi:hypothetical protein
MLSISSISRSTVQSAGSRPAAKWTERHWLSASRLFCAHHKIDEGEMKREFIPELIEAKLVSIQYGNQAAPSL